MTSNPRKKQSFFLSSIPRIAGLILRIILKTISNPTVTQRLPGAALILLSFAVCAISISTEKTDSTFLILTVPLGLYTLLSPHELKSDMSGEETEPISSADTAARNRY